MPVGDGIVQTDSALNERTAPDRMRSMPEIRQIDEGYFPPTGVFPHRCRRVLGGRLRDSTELKDVEHGKIHASSRVRAESRGPAA
jgi:hypothetical protein